MKLRQEPNLHYKWFFKPPIDGTTVYYFVYIFRNTLFLLFIINIIKQYNIFWNIYIYTIMEVGYSK